METNGMSDYEIRIKRYNDAVSLIEPDRVPFIPINFHFFPSLLAGISYKEGMYDHQRYYAALKACVLKYDFDMAPDSSVYAAQTFDALGLKNWKWPGHGVPEDRMFQYQETEVMKAEEYDQFLANPDGYTLRVLWPRIAQNLEPLGYFPPFFYYFNCPQFLGPFFAIPEVVNALESFKKLGESWSEHNKFKSGCYQELEKLGYPRTYAGVIFAPYDVLSVWMRGGKGTNLDLYRNPDKLLAVVDLFTNMQIQSGIAQAQFYGNPRVIVFAYRGAAGFMSNQHFEKFYWPSLRRLITGLIDQGVEPQVWFEGDITPRLPYLAEFPKGKVPIHYDWVDRKEAKKYVGNNCFWGNIPVSLMEYGTVKEVEEDVKELIDTFAPGGGLIIDSSNAISDDAKPENVEAVANIIHNFGRR